MEWTFSITAKNGRGRITMRRNAIVLLLVVSMIGCQTANRTTCCSPVGTNGVSSGVAGESIDQATPEPVVTVGDRISKLGSDAAETAALLPLMLAMLPFAIILPTASFLAKGDANPWN